MKRRVWKWLLGGVAVLVISFGGLLWSAHRRADQVFAHYDGIVAKSIAAIRARPSERPPLYEPSVEGNGWRSYEAAISGISAMTETEATDLPSMNGDPTFITDREHAAQVFEKYAPWVEELRTASRHRSFMPDLNYEAGLNMDMSIASSNIRVVRYLSDLAMHLHEEGQEAAALDVATLGIGMAHDSGRFGVILHHLVLIVCEGIAGETIREMLAGHSFQPAELERLARNLDRLSQARPAVTAAFMAEEALMRRSMIDTGRSGQPASMDWTPGTRSWRYLFSRKLVAAGALGELDEICKGIDSVGHLAPHLRPSAMDQVAKSAEASRNPFIRGTFPALGRAFLRDNVAQLTMTLLRVATAIAWYESERGLVPEKLDELVPRYLPRIPACPLTGLPLGYRDGAVWSPGRNGVNDGGVPGRNDDVDDDDGDVVWRVTRE